MKAQGKTRMYAAMLAAAIFAVSCSGDDGDDSAPATVNTTTSSTTGTQSSVTVSPDRAKGMQGRAQMIYYGESAMPYTAYRSDDLVKAYGRVDDPNAERLSPTDPHGGFIKDFLTPGLNPHYVSLPKAFGRHFGEWVEITYKGKTTKAQVVEMFDSQTMALMMSPAVLVMLGLDPDLGNWDGLAWEFIEAPPAGDGPWTQVTRV